jgi:O-antigen/teichoic acid export membrane protein
MFISLLVGSNVVRYYHEYPDEHRKRQVISVALINIWVVAIVVLPLLYLSSRQLSQLVFQTPDNFMLVNIILTTLVIGMSNDIPLSLLRIRERSVLFVSISMSRLVVNLGLNVLFVVKFGWGVKGILVGTLIASILSGIALTTYALRGPKLSYSWEIARSMWRYSAPLVGSMVGMFILSFSDRLFLERMTTLSQVGVYSLAYRFGMLPSMLVTGPFLQVWGPKRFEIAQQADALNIFGRVFTYFWMIQLWVGLGLCILIEDVISIMAAPEFHDAALYVPVLVLAYMAYGAYTFVQFGILYQKKTTYLAYNTMTVALLSLVSNFLLIPWIGAWGAVITAFLSFLLLLTNVHFIAQRLYRVSYETRRLVRMSLVAVALYVGSLFISIDSTYLSMMVNLLIGLSFPVWLYLVGFYEPEELAAARNLYQTFTARTR